MKAFIYLFTLLACISAQASLVIQIPTPQEDTALKSTLWRDAAIAPSLEVDSKEIHKLEEVLRAMKESQLNSIFGPAKPIDDSYVLPFCRPTSVAFSGLGYKGKSRMYFLPIGDVGGILVFPYGDRDFVSAVALYLKTDKTFRPAKKPDDLIKRREWDQKRLADLKAIILKSIKTEAAPSDGDKPTN